MFLRFTLKGDGVVWSFSIIYKIRIGINQNSWLIIIKSSHFLFSLLLYLDLIKLRQKKNILNIKNVILKTALFKLNWIKNEKTLL